jgi:hypothetical protein
MKPTLLLSLLLLLAVGARAEAAKGYQVTGQIVTLTDKLFADSVEVKDAQAAKPAEKAAEKTEKKAKK